MHFTNIPCSSLDWVNEKDIGEKPPVMIYPSVYSNNMSLPGAIGCNQGEFSHDDQALCMHTAVRLLSPLSSDRK